MSPVSPDLIINTAALANVPQCEKEPDKALLINSLGARNTALVASELDSILLYISTDYVFDGKKRRPYVEDDHTAPINTYGISKLAGEYYVRYLLDRYFIIRTSGLYGIHRCISKGINFVDKMLGFNDGDSVRVVSDEVLTPTYTLHLAQQIHKLVNSGDFGIYHVTNEGDCTWFEFSKAIFSQVGRDVNVIPISSADLQTEVRRPQYSVLENRNLKRLGINQMPNWRKSLKAYLIEKGCAPE